VTYELVVRTTAAGTELVGEAPQRIRISQELLDRADPALLKLDDQGDVMFTLTNTVLWYRRVELGDGWVEFERVA
jgi:hypothetical protein